MGKADPKQRLAIKSFEDLEAWQVCREVRRRVYEFTKKLPSSERYRLADQMVRASRSATANLAEGYGRFHYQETIQFARQARGSLYELFDHLTVALECKYIEAKEAEAIKAKALVAVRLLNGFIRYLRAKRENVKP